VSVARTAVAERNVRELRCQRDTTVKQIAAALGDSPDKPMYVERYRAGILFFGKYERGNELARTSGLLTLRGLTK